jgi:hypothetical protein
MRGAAGLLVAAGLSCGQISLAAEGVPSVTIAAERTIAEAYWAWSAKAPCEGVQSYALPDAPRGLTDLLLACRALRLGGYDGPLTVVAYPNYERALIEARKGAATIPAETLWEIDIDADHFYASEPVIRDGEFVSGLYTTPDRQDVLGVRSLGELQKYRTALPKVWHIGWETLQQMNLKEVVNVPHNEALFEVMRRPGRFHRAGVFQRRRSQYPLQGPGTRPDPGDQVRPQRHAALRGVQGRPSGGGRLQCLGKGAAPAPQRGGDRARLPGVGPLQRSSCHLEADLLSPGGTGCFRCRTAPFPPSDQTHRPCERHLESMDSRHGHSYRAT